MKNLTKKLFLFFLRRDIEIEAEEMIVQNRNLNRVPKLDSEACPQEELVVLLNSQKTFQQPNGKLSSA